MADERFDADHADDEVAAVLDGRAGKGADPTVLWLASAARPATPEGVVARINSQINSRLESQGAAAAVPERRRTDRPGLFLAGVAAILGFAFVFQGVGNLVAGEWIAKGLGEPYAPHPFREGGLAMIAIGVCAAAATVSRRWSTASVLTCSPLAVGFGLHGFTEIGVFGPGVALHLTQGVLGLLLVAAWWWDRRDRSHTAGRDSVAT